MHAAADAGGDETVWQTCATVAQAAVLVRAAMGCTAVANCRCECTGRCRTACIDRCKTNGKFKPVRDLHCVVGLHGRVQGAVQGCTPDPGGCRCTGWCASCAYCSGLFGRRVGGCRFRLQQECTSDVRTFKLRLVRVAAEVMELWRRSGDGLALGTDAPLAIERRPHVPVCPSVGGNLGELSAGDLPQQDFRGVRGCTSTSRAFYVNLT